MTCKKCTDAESAIALAEKRAMDAEADAARYRYIVENNVILTGPNDGAWPIAPFGRANCDKYIDAAIRSITSKEPT